MSTGLRLRPTPQDVYNHFARLSADQQLAVVLRFDGRLDEERLHDAVDRVLQQQPVLACRFAYEAGRARFEPAGGGAFSVTVAADPVAAVTDAAARPLDFAGTGVFSVTLVHGDTSDAIAMRVDHVAADGQGAKCIAESLAAAYSSPRGQAECRGAVPDRSARRLMRRFSVAARIRALRGRDTTRPTWGMPSLGGDPGTRRHALASIAAGGFSAVRASAKRSGATVNDALLAAFYRALFERLTPEEGRPMAVNVSFDMRRYLDASDPMPAAANLSSIETALLPAVAGEPFGRTLERVVEVMADLKRGTPGLGSAVLLEYSRLLGYRRVEQMAVEPMQRGRQHGVSFPFLSNFGVLDDAALAFGDAAPVAAFVLPPVGHPPFVMLGPSTYRSEMTLAVGYAEEESDGDAMRRFLAGMAADLVSWAAAGAQRERVTP